MDSPLSISAAITHEDQVLPLVSVILSSYNYGRFLKQSIDSVLEQTYGNVQLIVVDDGSTDNSREIIESYGSRFISIFQTNSGHASTVNKGIEQTTGEIICFLDADDCFHLEKISKVVQSFQEHPEWGQIGHSWLTINAEGEIVGKSTSNILSQGDVKDLLLSCGRYASAISSALACRRSILNKVMPIRKWGADTYLNVTMPFYTLIGSINEPLMYYRMHGNNVRAYSNDLPFLIQQREATANFINETAALTGITSTFDINNDPDYRSYLVMKAGKTSLAEFWKIINLSLRESRLIKRSFRDTLIRLLNRGVAGLLPSEGVVILRMGFRRYIRFRFFGQEPRY